METGMIKEPGMLEVWPGREVLASDTQLSRPLTRFRSNIHDSLLAHNAGGRGRAMAPETISRLDNGTAIEEQTQGDK